jgi:D-serine deaminase-like pyridoxal phosphate-dependent protein
MRIEDLDTPAVVIDLDIMERNLARMAGYAKSKNIALRPHSKTHKIPDIAKAQIAAGARGIVVAKPGEARVMADNGVDNIMIAYPLVTPAKAQAAAELARHDTICVSLDSPEAVEALGEAAAKNGSKIGVLVEIDTGFHRCGVEMPRQAVALARQAMRYPNLDFLGLMFYPGHLAKPPEEQPPLIASVNRILESFYQVFRSEQIDIRIVSGGSTPTAYRSHEFAGVTEIRPGMYLLNDANLVRLNVSKLEDCALHVIATVVSTAVPGRAIIDGGSKTFSSDRSKGDKAVFGMIREDPDTDFVALSEEHGHFDITRSKHKYRVGERLRILPNHVCATVNLHDRLYGVRNGVVERVWEVAGRGKVQ